jgi:hypothetical protein
MKKVFIFQALIAMSLFAVMVSGCVLSEDFKIVVKGMGSSSSSSSGIAVLNRWTWVSGSKFVDQNGIYGTYQVADVNNIPGTRYGSMSWMDLSGNFWLFGGYGRGKTGMSSTYLNDLWKFDGNNWTWVSGSNVTYQKGIYGIQGTPALSNVPGSRNSGFSWIDNAGNLWLFGGEGLDSSGTVGLLNDLWKFDGTNWTWVSGSDTVNHNGSYGMKGTPNPANIPGSRKQGVTWIDSSGYLMLFGGSGFDSVNAGADYLNDLWKFDGTNWTWVSGSDVCGQYGSYGIKGVVNPANIPGGRESSLRWVDGSGNVYIFGGNGDAYYSGSTNQGSLNDLWKFNGSQWTWVSGSSNLNETGVYGIKGVAGVSNIPGSRSYGVCWIDGSGSLWLFGGFGFDGTGSGGFLNDLWKYDGVNWIWVTGKTNVGQSGIYGSLGVTDPANIPGGRNAVIGWTDNSGNFWLFGGSGIDSGGSQSKLNDLWKYEP